MTMKKRDKLAILIPCYNEATTIAEVVKEYKGLFPGVVIYVYDNNSNDNTFEIARNAGAIVRNETYQGKGSVVRRMFSDVDADIYLLVDGDMTYNSAVAPEMIEKLKNENLDMVVCARTETSNSAYRSGHKLGNYFFTTTIGYIFGRKLSDINTGYRAFSRRFVKTFPSHSKTFDLESEITIHSLEMRLPVSEINTDYFPRPEGSVSKLSTYTDGLKILSTIIKLIFSEKPFAAYSIVALFLLLTGGGWGWHYVLQPWFETGLVNAMPSAILSTGLVILSFLMFTTALVVQATKKQRKEVFRYNYLRYSLECDSD